MTSAPSTGPSGSLPGQPFSPSENRFELALLVRQDFASALGVGLGEHRPGAIEEAHDVLRPRLALALLPLLVQRRPHVVPRQIALIKESWIKVVPIKETAADLLYARLFELDPALRPMFRQDLTEQKRRLMEMLNRIVAMLGDFDALARNAWALGRRHVPYGVKP
jgi:hypothetical protein